MQEELKLLGLNNLKHSIFYNCHNGIRFEIGMGEVYDDSMKPLKKYIENALSRVITIYNNGIQYPSFLMWEVYPQNDKERNRFEILFSEKIAPVLPQEKSSENVNMDGYSISQTQLFWNLKETKIPMVKLFREILLGDLGDLQEFVSSVYIFDIVNHVMFHLYDDRGLDIVARDKNTLIPLYQELNEWILDYDIEQIDERFSD